MLKGGRRKGKGEKGEGGGTLVQRRIDFYMKMADELDGGTAKTVDGVRLETTLTLTPIKTPTPRVGSKGGEGGSEFLKVWDNIVRKRHRSGGDQTVNSAEKGMKAQNI